MALGAVSLAAGGLYTLIKMGPVAYSYFEEFGTILGEVSDIITTTLSPVLDPLIDLLWGLVDIFDNLPAPVKTVISVIATIAGAIAGLSAIVGLLGGGFGTVSALIMAALGPVIAFFAANPIVLAIIAIIAIIWLLWTNWDTVMGYLTAAWNKLVEIASSISGKISDAWTGLKDSISKIWPVS